MNDATDMDLLQQYARQNSEEAFATLVTRYVNLVYSAALRKTGNPHAAEEITQAVFIILAKKAGNLRSGTILSGWLYQTACLTAANFLRNEIRRAHREQVAYMQSLDNETEPNTWLQIAPHLEDAMGQLAEKDRNAIALRFFEGKTFHEVGNAFGASENAAKKRVAHALEKLRKYFAKRGVVTTSVIIAGVISANSVQAAPAALATSISAVAMANGAAVTGSTLTLVKGALKLMAWTKMKTTIVVGVAALLATGTTALVIQQTHQPQPTLIKEEQTEFPRATWTFAGYATPQSAFLSAAWARSKPDRKIYLASLAPGELQRDKNDMQRRIGMTGKSEDEVAREIAKVEMGPVTGFSIDHKETISDDEVLLHLKVHGVEKNLPARIKKIGNEWKFDGFQKPPPPGSQK